MTKKQITSASPSDTALGRRGRAGRLVWWSASVLVAITLVAYLPAIVSGGFIWDDDDYLLNNPNLQDVEGLARLWVPRVTRQYYPLTFTTFWIEHTLWGFHPLGYHLVNVLLHAANALLVWRLFTTLRVPGAWMIAAVFALHPVHVESVAWITERKNVLAGCFYLLAALAYLRFDAARFDGAGSGGAPDDADGRRPWRWYAAAQLLFVAALLSKSITCSLPAALILALLWLRRPLSAARLLPLAPMFAVGLLLALHTAHLERSNVGAAGAEFDFSFAEHLLIASRALLFYPWKLLAPWPLVFIYPKWSPDPSILLTWWPIGLLLGIAAAVVILWRRRCRGPALALAFSAGTIFPALGFFNIYPMRYSFVADHFQYLASLGVIALIVGGLARWFAPATVSRALAAVALLVLGGITWHQSTQYAGAEILWRRTIEANPGCWMCHNNLGNILTRRGEAEAALPHYRAALAANPDHYQSQWNLAAALDMLQRHAEAVEQWRLVLAHEQATGGDWAMLGTSLNQADRTDEAVDTYLEAIGRWPRHLTLRLKLGRALVRLNRPDEAVEHFEVVLAADPANAGVRGFVARWYEDRGNHAQALRHHRLAVQHAATDRDAVVATFALARFLALCPDTSYRDPGEALRLAEPLSRATGGGDPLVLDTLAAAYAGLGRHTAAIATARRALQRARVTGGYEALVPQIEARLEAYRTAAGQP